jgi:putative endonuclease
MYYLYILYSEKLNKYYVGSTQSIEERVRQHNSGEVHFTSRGIPWKLCYVEELPDRTSVMKREYEIKRKKSRRYIEWLISKSS